MIDPLTLDQMRVLVAVAETGSFSAAARKLGRVQSAISQAVQTMETALRPRPVRSLAQNAVAHRYRRRRSRGRPSGAHAHPNDAGARAGHRDDLEPELTLAVDATFPMPLLMKSLEALREPIPDAAGDAVHRGARRRARNADERRGADGDLSDPRRAGPEVDAEFLARVALAPVVAGGSSAGSSQTPARREDLEAHVQLVLTGRNAFAQTVRGGIVSPHIWRFADLATRLEFLLAGFGWCNMPLHMVEKSPRGPAEAVGADARRAAAGISCSTWSACASVRSAAPAAGLSRTCAPGFPRALARFRFSGRRRPGVKHTLTGLAFAPSLPQ